ncbi:MULTISPECIES: helix-turn-helix transcriptional regulator [Rhizobium]|nr:transcriptional regulator [Rhizobium wenxiniae]
MPYMIYSDQYGQFGTMGQPDQGKILSPALCRAGRGFLDWTQCDLADRSGVSRSTIRDYEGDRHEVHRSTEAQLRRAFEEGGLAFVTVEDGCVAICPKDRKTASD